MQTASELKQKGARRTKVVRADGTAFETLSGVALARNTYTAEAGFISVTEIYGYDPDIDGPRRGGATAWSACSRSLTRTNSRSSQPGWTPPATGSWS